MKKALLISSSFNHGLGYLEHAREAILQFLGTPTLEKHVLFVPYAKHEKDWDEYASSAREFFTGLGYGFKSIHDLYIQSFSDRTDIVRDSKLLAIFVGGGNTFRLLSTLYSKSLIEDIDFAVSELGVKYIGSSAGTLVSCPSIKTTNDMPIVYPKNPSGYDGFRALGLIPVQVNAHFVSGSLAHGHMGETREQRIKEFHEEQETPVIGLPENSWLVVEDSAIRLEGKSDAVFFRRDEEPRPWPIGETVDFSKSQSAG